MKMRRKKLENESRNGINHLAQALQNQKGQERRNGRGRKSKKLNRNISSVIEEEPSYLECSIRKIDKEKQEMSIEASSPLEESHRAGLLI